jgi:hypothetical protein
MKDVLGVAVVAAVVVGALAASGSRPALAAEGAGAVEVVIESTSEEGGAAPGAAPHQEGTAGEAAAPASGASGKAAAKGAKGKDAVAKAGSAKGGGAVDGEQVKAKFSEFCAGWVDKLRAREKYNVEKIKWEPAGTGVVGEYVGYDTKNVGPETVDHLDTVPIGKLTYMELKLRRTGNSKEEALAQEPEIVERTEVLEIFRFERGAWVY